MKASDKIQGITRVLLSGRVQKGLISRAKFSPGIYNVHGFKSHSLQTEISQRTVYEILLRHVRDILGKDDGKATGMVRQHNTIT